MLSPTDRGTPRTQRNRPSPALIAAFTHRLSRHRDPHLHAHVIVVNTTLGSNPKTGEREWCAADLAKPIYESAHLDRLVQAEMARLLAARGYAVELDKDGRTQLPGIPEAIITKYSKGRQALDAAEAEAPLPADTDRGRVRDLLNRKIRPPKSDIVRSTLSRLDRQTILDLVRLRRRRKSKRRPLFIPPPVAAAPPGTVDKVRPNALNFQLAKEERERLAEAARATVQDSDLRRHLFARSLRRFARTQPGTPLGVLIAALFMVVDALHDARARKAAVLGRHPDAKRDVQHAVTAKARGGFAAGPAFVPNRAHAVARSARSVSASPTSPTPSFRAIAIP